MDLSHEYANLFNDLLSKYKVNNLIGDESKIIFILESPHVDELYYEAPVSGLSGGTMSKALFGDSYKLPLGRLLKESLGKDDCSLDIDAILKKVGIINICNIPMQTLAYTHCKTVEKYGEFNASLYGDFLTSLEKIRNKNKALHKEMQLNVIQDIILNEFKASLSNLMNKEVYLVPCGKTAQIFFQAAEIELRENWTLISDVPHPSYNSWAREKYQPKIKEILKALEK